MVSQSTKNSGALRAEEQEPGDVDRARGERRRPVSRGPRRGGWRRGRRVVRCARRRRCRRSSRGSVARRAGPAPVSGGVEARLRACRGADEVEQVGAFGLVELQGAGDAFEDVVGHAVGVAAFEPRVVLDADPGEHRHFLAAQALDPPVRAVDGKPGLFGGDLGAAGGRGTRGCRPCRPRRSRYDASLSRWESLLVPLLTAVSLAVGSVVGWSTASSRVDDRGGCDESSDLQGPGSIEVGSVPTRHIEQPTDAVVRVVMACVCGSDLWYYRGESEHAVGSIGHEFIGVVEDVGADVTAVAVGDLVVAPFIFSDMSCPHCRHGSTISCAARRQLRQRNHRRRPRRSRPGPARRQHARAGPRSGHSDAMLRSLLTLSDVMATGHHAAVSAGVKPGDTVAVVGDGAVGLSAVLAAKRLGAERIIALSRHADRQRIARQVRRHRHRRLPRRRGEHRRSSSSPPASVSTPPWSASAPQQSIDTAAAIARPGSTIGIVGVPHGDGAVRRHLLPQHRLARRPRPGPHLHPRAARRRPRRHHQPRPGARLRDRPRRHRPRPTRRWTTAARSSPSSGSGASDGHLDRATSSTAIGSSRGARARLPPSGRHAAAGS